MISKYDNFLSILKLIIISSAIYHLGFLYGISILIIIRYIYSYIIFKIFNLEPMTIVDNVFISADNNSREKVNLMAYLQFKNGFDAEKIKQLFIDKAIKKVRKLRCKPIHFLGNYFWQEQPLQKAIERVKIINQNNIANDQQMLAYIQQEINIYFDQLNEIPYEIKIIPYTNNNSNNHGAIVFKFDHCLSDGLGMLSLIAFIADNYNPESYPSIMKNYKISWLKEILSYFSFIYYGPIFFYNISRKVGDSSPFRNDKKRLSGKVVFPKPFDIEINKFDKLRKELKISFNDVILCAVSKAFNRLCSDGSEYKDIKQFKLFFPIGRKPVPKSYDEILINNESNSVSICIPLINPSNKESYEEDKKLANILRNTLMKKGFVIASKLMSKLCLELYPRKVINSTLEDFTNQIDLVVSNLPGPSKKLSYAGYEVNQAKAFGSLGRARVFLLVFSYDNKVTFNLNIDDSLAIEGEKFMEYLKEELTLSATAYAGIKG